MSSSQEPDLQNSGIYRVIRILFGADLVIGLALAAIGYWVLEAPPLWIVGLGLAAVGLLMLWLFPLLMRRSAERGRNNPGS
ncbi:MAG TPA: hypothetical protein VHA10_08945 [Hypericibacter adhaerens]|jgi:hypothetical protein|uniref:Uncharacterized protein n=1 Tax=Hypericibacter adhaerens TaxID=2602016 RepID=A0A5J6N7X1_9PROT|nr:hypothetical protein [Hypericibacter adhaerens]QEX25023.1 hypothetical protein FRZ61_49670 [Hypericibacter adhaerens]HWA43324.1 hypothetical protein [Hypericibacter adhaerens]